MENGLIKMLIQKLKLENGEQIDFCEDKWCGSILFSPKFLKVYTNSNKKILTMKEADS